MFYLSEQAKSQIKAIMSYFFWEKQKEIFGSSVHYLNPFLQSILISASQRRV